MRWPYNLFIASCMGGLIAGLLLYHDSGLSHVASAEPERKSITFIMGEDKSSQPYYSLAADHFALDTENKTDYVVRTCRTLGDVITYLNQSPSRGYHPWSVVNIVAHGNPQTGLNIQITEEGHKATPKRLLQAALRNDTPVLEADVVDSKTLVHFWSCGIGTSPIMQVALRSIFKTDTGDSVHIHCPTEFIVFHPALSGIAPRMVRASYWPYYFRRGYRPSDSEIIHALRTRFPEEEIAWDEAVTQTSPSFSNRPYHGEYHIPVSYTRIYQEEEERPSVNTQEEKLQWVQAQPEIRDQLEQTGIPMDHYTWTVNKIIHTRQDGTKVPAIKAIGMATVLYVLKEK